MLQPVITPLGSRHDTGTAQVGQLRFIHTVRTVWCWPEGLLMNPTLHFCLQAVQDQQVTMASYLWRFNMPSWSALFPALAWQIALPSGRIVPGSEQGASYVSLVAPTNRVVSSSWNGGLGNEKYRKPNGAGHHMEDFFIYIYRWQKNNNNSKYCST